MLLLPLSNLLGEVERGGAHALRSTLVLLPEIVGMQRAADTLADSVKGGCEFKLSVAPGGVLVDGEVPLFQLSSVPQPAQRPAVIVHVAEASAD